MASQLAWIGLGNMGRGMVRNIVSKGNLSQPIIIFNRTQKRAHDLAKEIGTNKVKVASTIEDAVRPADIIFTCVSEDQAINDTISKALQVGAKGKLFVDCSTVHPETTNKLGKQITEAGAHFVASPVFGAVAMADAGQLVFVLAGPRADVDKVLPYAKGVMGRENIEFADQPYGNASLMKLIGNSFVLQMVEALSEGHTVAEKTGLGSENLHKFLQVMFPGPYVAYSSRMMSGDYYAREEPAFASDLALKDARHVLDLASANGAKMRAVELVQDHLKDVKSRKGTKGDLAGVYGAVRAEAGLQFENK